MPKALVPLLLYAGALLAAVLLLGEAFDLRIGPVWIFLGIVLLGSLLIVLVKFPAMFLVPVLFVSRLRDLPLPARFHGLIDTTQLTQLTVVAALLSAALFIRLLRLLSRRQSHSLGELFRNQGKGIAAFVLFAAVVAISYLYTPSPNYGGIKLLSFLGIDGGLTFFGAFILLSEERDFRHLAWAHVGLAVVLTGSRLVSTSGGEVATGENIVHIGIGQLIGVSILLILNYRFAKGRWAQRLLILCLPWLAAGLIAAEARGPVLSLVIVLGASLFARRRKMSLISPRTAMLGVAVVLAALFIVPAHFFSGEAADRYREKTRETLAFTKHGSFDDRGSGGQRLIYFGAALSGMAKNPVAGWGVGGWSSYYWHRDDWQYPHNVFLEVGFEQGLLGLAAFCAFLAVAFKAAKKTFDEASGRFAFLLPVLAYSVLLILSSGDIDDCRFLWFWPAAAFAALRLARSQQQEEVPDKLSPALES